MVGRGNLCYKTNKYTYNFHNFRTKSTFGRDIYSGTVTTKDADDDHFDLLIEILNFRKQLEPKNPENKEQKEDVFKNLYNLFEGRKRVFNAFDSKIFPMKIEGTGFSDRYNLKILPPKQMLQRLPIAIAQAKEGNTSENLQMKSVKSYIFCIEQKSV